MRAVTVNQLDIDKPLFLPLWKSPKRKNMIFDISYIYKIYIRYICYVRNTWEIYPAYELYRREIYFRNIFKYTRTIREIY